MLLLFFVCGMASYGIVPRIQEAVTASASFAIISTASKHLQNDLARAIEALEQKKSVWCDAFAEGLPCSVGHLVLS